MTHSTTTALGIDVGGSGIKGAIVDLKTGEFLTPRLRIPTPAQATPHQVTDIITQILTDLNVSDHTPLGVSFPAPIVNGVVPIIANLSPEFIGVNFQAHLSQQLQRPVTVLNDADAAGYGEVRYGAARHEKGTAIMLTLGTGIGSALIRNRKLVPNSELGHVYLPNGIKAEHFAAASVQERENLSYAQWADRLQIVFSHLEMLFSPDVFIVGGGISKKHKHFLPLIDTKARLVPAKLRNAAGIVGAAKMAAKQAKHL